MSTDEKREDRYEELLQLAREQMSMLERAVEDLKRVQRELEWLRRR